MLGYDDQHHGLDGVGAHQGQRSQIICLCILSAQHLVGPQKRWLTILISSMPTSFTHDYEKEPITEHQTNMLIFFPKYYNSGLKAKLPFQCYGFKH
jgi:hypothetical protein